MSRLKYIDALKGFAIIFVVIGHVANGYLNLGTTDSLYIYTHKVATSFHMPLFFAVSAFLFSRAYFAEDGRVKQEKLKIQIINLIWIYIIFGVALWTLKALVFSSFVNSQLSVLDLLLIPFKPFDIYWYLYILILYYIVFSRKCLINFRMTRILMFSLVFAISSYWIPETWPFGIKRFMYYLPLFSLGCVLSQRVELLDSKKWILLIPPLLLLFIVFWNHELPFNSIRFVNLAIGGVLLSACFVYSSNSRFWEKTKYCCLLAKEA